MRLNYFFYKHTYWSLLRFRATYTFLDSRSVRTSLKCKEWFNLKNPKMPVLYYISLHTDLKIMVHLTNELTFTLCECSAAFSNILTLIFLFFLNNSRRNLLQFSFCNQMFNIFLFLWESTGGLTTVWWDTYNYKCENQDTYQMHSQPQWTHGNK